MEINFKIKTLSILLSTLCITTNVFANDLLKSYNNNLLISGHSPINSQIKKDYINLIKFRQYLTFKVLKNSPQFKDYLRITGERENVALKDLNMAYKNNNFMKAMYYYLHPYRYNVNYPKIKKVNHIYMPNYHKVLKYLNEAVKNTKNPFIAWLGLDILQKYYMAYINGSKEAKQYLKSFAIALKNRNYCIGFLYYGRTFFKEFSKIPNYSKAYYILNKGRYHCLYQKKIPYYIMDSLKKYRVKSEVLKEYYTKRR